MDERTSGPAIPTAPQFVMFEAIMPAAIAARAEEAGVAKASTDPLTVLMLAILGGAFISFGAIFSTTVSAGAGVLPFGVARLLSGLTFSVGLVLVVVAGAELFTGNNLIVMAWASGRVKTRALLFNWALVFTGNFVGAFATAVLMLCTQQYRLGAGNVGLAALQVAQAKVELELLPAFVLGIMCNTLVCLAVWMSYSGRSAMDKIATVILPVAAFVTAGFEHCVANIYFIVIGIFIKSHAPDSFWRSVDKSPADYADLTWSSFIFSNLLPVTLGNVIGGAVMVAAVYWFIYLRGAKRVS